MKKSLSDPMAVGRTAEVFFWDDQHVLKLYRDWCPPDWVDYEARIARAVCDAGIPTPAPGEIVEVNGRRGLVYERVEGISMLQDMNSRPWTLWKHAKELADLHVKLNLLSIPDLPSYKQRLEYDIRQVPILSEDLRRKVLSILENLPDKTNLCHGDYHPGNVLITKDGPVIIDWVTACSGSPWADVARTNMILHIGAKAAGKQVHPIVMLLIKSYQRDYDRRYHSHVPDPGNELDRWTPVIAAARLIENILPEREGLMKMIQES
jgi:uncharacterized protein (TIGR02172 family)